MRAFCVFAVSMSENLTSKDLEAVLEQEKTALRNAKRKAKEEGDRVKKAKQQRQNWEDIEQRYAKEKELHELRCKIKRIREKKAAKDAELAKLSEEFREENEKIRAKRDLVLKKCAVVSVVVRMFQS